MIALVGSLRAMGERVPSGHGSRTIAQTTELDVVPRARRRCRDRQRLRVCVAGAVRSDAGPDAARFSPDDRPRLIVAGHRPRQRPAPGRPRRPSTGGDRDDGLIGAGGPYPFPQDGAVFENRESLLPDADDGYYHEYTVETPGSADRGARRIVVGNQGEAYWTDDHYASFWRIVP